MSVLALRKSHRAVKHQGRFDFERQQCYAKIDIHLQLYSIRGVWLLLHICKPSNPKNYIYII